MALEILKPLHTRHPNRTEYSSLAFKAVMEWFDEKQGYGVLDLGPAVGANVDFFSGFSCQIYVADMFRALESKRVGTPEDEINWDPIFEELLPYDEASRFDLVLAWDTLNYLSRAQIEAMMKRVSAFCARDAVVFAMISTLKAIPAQPRSYHITSSNRLVYQTPSQAVRPCPLYKEPDLLRLMPRFKVKGTYILRNGIQEYLLTFNS